MECEYSVVQGMVPPLRTSLFTVRTHSTEQTADSDENESSSDSEICLLTRARERIRDLNKVEVDSVEDEEMDAAAVRPKGDRSLSDGFIWQMYSTAKRTVRFSLIEVSASRSFRRLPAVPSKPSCSFEFGVRVRTAKT